MFKKLNTYAFILGTLLYAFFLPNIDNDYIALYFTNYFALVSFCSLNYYIIRQNNSFFNIRILSVITFTYPFLLVAIYKILSYSFNQNFFVFSESDAVAYHDYSIIFARTSYSEALKIFLKHYNYEDLGVFIIITSLYKFIESNLIYSFYNIIIGVFTARLIYKTANYSLPNRHAFLCAIAYCASSFVIWFHASGLKESTMVFLVVSTFYNYYRYQLNKNYKTLLACIATLLFLLLFRPAIVYLIILAILFSILISRKRSASTYVLLIIIVSILLLYASNFSKLYTQFTYGSTTELIYAKETEGMIKGGILLTYVTNIISALIGPFPTILNLKLVISFYAPGLIFKLLMSFFYVIGSIYIIKNKVKILYPILFFSFLELGSLAFILEALELRKSLCHFPFIYIISFWCIYQIIENNQFTKRIKLKPLFSFYITSVILLVIFWNSRF